MANRNFDPRQRPKPDEVEQLLLNAELRNELEPFDDEAFTRLNLSELPTDVENKFLACLLAWERAPVISIAQWFEPELKLPHPDTLNDEQLHRILWSTIEKLYEKRIVLDFADHLSDRQLYIVIYRDILPAREKKVDTDDNYLHWDCADASGDPNVWLRYYASDEERRCWLQSCGAPLPPTEPPPFPRKLPQRPL